MMKAHASYRALAIAAAGAAVVGLASVASAQQLQMAPAYKQIFPQRIAGIDAQGNVVTPWYDYSHSGSNPANRELLFDCYSPEDEMGLPGKGLDLCPTLLGPCGSQSCRWFLGYGTRNVYFTNDIDESAPGGDYDKLHLAWFWEVTEQCVINVWTSDEFDTTCAGPAFSGQHSGVALDFDVVPGSLEGYYYTDVNLYEFNLSLVHPSGSQGGYQILIANDTNQTLATMAQPALWGTHNFENPVYDPPGRITATHWNDLNFNKEFNPPTECQSYALAVCPDPLGAMLALYGEGTGGRDYQIEIIGFCPGTVTLRWQNALPNRQQAILIAPQERSVTIPPNNPCEGTQLDIGPLNQILHFQNISTGNGSGQVQGNAPRQVCGQFVQLVTLASPCQVSNHVQLR